MIWSLSSENQIVGVASRSGQTYQPQKGKEKWDSKPRARKSSEKWVKSSAQEVPNFPVGGLPAGTMGIGNHKSCHFKAGAVTGCEGNHFYSLPFRQAELAFTSPGVISTSPKSFLTSRIDFTVLLLFEFLKKITCALGKLKTEFTSLIAKSTNPGLSDTTSLHAE